MNTTEGIFVRTGLLLCCCALMLGSGGQEGVTSDVGLDSVVERNHASPGTEGAVPEGLSADDWAGIRSVHEAESYAACPLDRGYQARNPGQQWLTRFDGRGFHTEPDVGHWMWGLHLERYGFAGTEIAVTVPDGVSAQGGRVTYHWNKNLEEWYVNDSRGLEHGYTIHQRPVRGDEANESPLTLTLAVGGNLCPEVAAGGRDVRFLDAEDAVVLTYSGLSVFDADGREVQAGFDRVAEGLRLSVHDRGARYPLTIDPIAQQAYLKASNTETWDAFGASVAVSGDTVVVGAPAENSGATGVNGNQSDNSAPNAGAVYVFARGGTSWSQEAYLKASNTDANDYFGESVAIWGDTLLVGASKEDSGAKGVNGNQANNGAPDAGAAYVFVRNGLSWSQQAYLKASNTQGSDFFGNSVGVSENTVVVGAWKEDSNATGVNGSQLSNSAPGSGAAYVFVRNGTAWTQQAYLKASNTDPWDSFGTSLAVLGDTVVVGAPEEDSLATGVGGNHADNSAQDAGASYVFVRSGTIWSHEAYLKASNTDAGDYFGRSLAIAGDTIVVGAWAEDSNATGVNGDQSNDDAADAGAAYVFVRNGMTWGQEGYLKASNTDAGDRFGFSVAVAGDMVVVAASNEASSATGPNGDETDNSASGAGATYMFKRHGTSWSQQAYLKASNTESGDEFGWSVSLSDKTLVVGAIYESSNATGVNGDESDNSAPEAGAAYVIDLTMEPGISFGGGGADCGGSFCPCPCANNNDGSLLPDLSGCAGTMNPEGARLKATGIASVTGDTVVLVADHVKSNTWGLFFKGNIQLLPGVPMGGLNANGLLQCASKIKRFGPLQADGIGYVDSSAYASDLHTLSAAAAGDSRCYQWWYRTPKKSGPCSNPSPGGSNTSNGYAITWAP